MEFRILGPIEVIGPLGPINLGGPQPRRAMAVLLSDPGRVLTYDRLVEVLRPDNDEPLNARRAAITCVSRLRSALGDGAVETTDAGYLLNPRSMSLDADRFVALLDQARSVPSDRAVDVLDEALALWRGPVFGDLNGEWWARPLVKKLEEFRLTAMAERIDALTANGWDGRAVAEATSLIDTHPLREQFVEKAMRGLHAVGQTADALRVFHRYRSELAEQTGLDPSVALCELESSMATGTVLQPSPADLARPLRGYVLRELIGKGSFGAVYRATQPGVERDVAVKVIRPDLADDRSFVHRFEAEAQLVARLEHPHIVPLYDFWRQPGGAFLVFRLMRGGSADALVARDGPFTLERAGAVLTQIGGALTAAHAERVVHRDVKPANILFDDNGLAYLADFGIAASFANEPVMPPRWSAGSALYASPEQLRDGIEDARADQYALAVTIWELLTARAPFGGRDASSVMMTKLHDALGAVDEFCPGVAPTISTVLSRAGAVHPLDRYASVAEFVAAWQRAYTGAVAGDTDPSNRADAATPARVAASTTADIGRPIPNPYKGLRPFREGDAGEFYGREELVDRLLAAMRCAPFLAIVGPSGSGKSSLALAGLIPRQRALGCLVATMSPGESPVASLANALSQIAVGEQADLLSPAAMRQPDGLRTSIETIAGADELVIVIDQLEELWTLTSDVQRRRFLTALVESIGAGYVRVVATIRADFFDRPLADSTLGPLASKHTFGVTPMTAAELHEVITAPAEQVGVRFEPALVSQLVAETIDQPGSLPLLQFTLAELFERRHGAVIAADAYDELGGLAGSLSRQADEIYDGLGATDRAAVRRMFSRLVTPGEGSDDTRRKVGMAGLAGVPDRVVATFVNRRLLTSDRDRATREPTLEVAHEVLLRSWPRLRSWIDEDRAWLRELRGLSSAAALWETGGCEEGDLYRGARLAVVGEMAVAHEDALTALEHRFLAESLDHGAANDREAQRRLDDKVRQNKRLRRSVVGIAAVLAVATATGAIAVVQRQRADRQQRVAVAQRLIADQQTAEADQQKTIAQGERTSAVAAASEAQQAASQARDAKKASELTTLASRSSSLRSSQRDLAALLGVEAWRRSPDVNSKSALFGTFTFDPGFLGYLHLDGSPYGRIIPGTTNMLITTYDATGGSIPRLVDVVTGDIGVQLDPLVNSAVQDANLAISGNGRFAAEWATTSTSFDGPSVAAVFDLSTGHKIGATIQLPNLWHELAVDDTGSRLVLEADEVGAATVYDTNSGQALAHLPALTDAPPSTSHNGAGALAFAADGRLYLGSRGDRLRVFDPSTYAMINQIPVPPDSTSLALEIGSDGQTLVATGVTDDSSGFNSQLGSIARIDLSTNKLVWSIGGKDYPYGECDSYTFSVETDQLWCGNYFGLIHERSLTTGARTGRVLEDQRGKTSGLALIKVPGGLMLVGAVPNADQISRWLVNGAGPIQRVVAPGQTVVSDLPDGKTLLVVQPSGRAFPSNLDYTLWDTTTDAATSGLPNFWFARSVGNNIFGVFAGGTPGGYNVATKLQRSFAFSVDTSHAATLNRDGSVAVVGYDDGHAIELDAATGQTIQTVQIPKNGAGDQPSVDQVTIDDDHSRIYISGWGGLYGFDATTGQEIAHNEGHGIGDVAISSQGVLVATSFDGTIAIYDPDTLTKTASLPGARGFIQGMRFSDDGTVLAAAGNDGTVSIYDMHAHVRLGDPIPSDIGKLGLLMDLRGDGAQVAVAAPSGGAGVVLWDLDPAHWETAACAIAGRNLTREEWATYIGDLGDYQATCPEYPLPTSSTP